MPLTKIVFADISLFRVRPNGGAPVEIEGIQNCQVNEPAENRPIFTWNRAYPRLIVSVPVLGSGSFSYICSDGEGSTLEENWKLLLPGGRTEIELIAGLTRGSSQIMEGVPTTIRLHGIIYQGKSFGMNARNEGIATINFAYTLGLNNEAPLP